MRQTAVEGRHGYIERPPDVGARPVHQEGQASPARWPLCNLAIAAASPRETDGAERPARRRSTSA